MFINRFGGGGGEDITPELNAQGTKLDNMLNNLGQVGVWQQQGLFVWEKYDEAGGNLIEHVTSNVSTEFPDGGEKEGYWYNRFDPVRPAVQEQFPIVAQMSEALGVECDTEQTGCTKHRIQQTNENLNVICGEVEETAQLIQAQHPLVNQILETLVGKATGANATEDTILDGFSAWVQGVLVHGNLVIPPEKTLADFGIDFGTVTISSDRKTFMFDHGLGKKPSICFIITNGVNSIDNNIFAVTGNYEFYRTDGSAFLSQTTDRFATTANTITVTEFPQTKNYFKAGTVYHWFAIA